MQQEDVSIVKSNILTEQETKGVRWGLIPQLKRLHTLTHKLCAIYLAKFLQLRMK